MAGPVFHAMNVPSPEDVCLDRGRHRAYIAATPHPRPRTDHHLDEAGALAPPLDPPAQRIGRAGWLDLVFDLPLKPAGEMSALPAFLNPPLPVQVPPAALVDGAVLAVDLRNPAAPPVNLTHRIAALGRFRPIGIDLFIVDDERARLFVGDQPEDGRARVVVFDVDRATGALTLADHGLVEDIARIRAPNGIAAAGADAFYMTNFRGGRFEFLKTAELLSDVLAHVGFGSIVHGQKTQDGWHVEEVLGMQRYPNGIALSLDGTRLFVAYPLQQHITEFDIADGGRRLRPRRDIAVPIVCDNLHIDPKGNLWVAGSPDTLGMMSYSAGYLETVPSDVLCIVDPTGAAEIRREFHDSGGLIAAASVGVHDAAAGKLVVGAPFQDRLLIVDI